MIEVNNLSVSYGKGRTNVIENMSFHIDRGCILNILGQNAVGKTTLIRTLMRELQEYSGSIKVNDKEICEYSIKEYSQLVGVVSTSFNTYQNLLVADYLVTGFINQMAPISKPDSNHVKTAFSILSEFGKENLFNKRIDNLSSGERQIVMIARVLLQNPEIIIVDEPTANLDVKNQIIVLNLIKKLSHQGYTILVTTHNPGHAYSIGGKTLIMGKCKYSFGDTNEILVENILSDYYDLDVRIQAADDYKYMVFRDYDNKESAKIVF